jgi:hypothetical protein
MQKYFGFALLFAGYLIQWLQKEIPEQTQAVKIFLRH